MRKMECIGKSGEDSDLSQIQVSAQQQGAGPFEAQLADRLGWPLAESGTEPPAELRPPQAR